MFPSVQRVVSCIVWYAPIHSPNTPPHIIFDLV